MTTTTLVRPSVTAAPLNRKDIFGAAAAIARSQLPGSKLLKSINGGEWMEIGQLRAVPIAGSALEVVAQAYEHKTGKSVAPAGEAPNIGHVMDAVPMNRDEVHPLMCECLGGVDGDRAATMLDNLAR